MNKIYLGEILEEINKLSVSLTDIKMRLQLLYASNEPEIVAEVLKWF